MWLARQIQDVAVEEPQDRLCIKVRLLLPALDKRQEEVVVVVYSYGGKRASSSSTSDFDFHV